MRLLHPRIPHDDLRGDSRKPRSEPGGGARDDRGQPVPLHRLSEHRRIGLARRRVAARTGRAGAGRAGAVTTRSIGEPIARVEDERLVTGRGKYVDDVLPGALEMAVLRSPHAHAKILSIEIDEVLDLEGVHAVYTYEDLPGSMAEPLPLLIPHPTLTHGRTQYALAQDRKIGRASCRERV